MSSPSRYTRPSVSTRLPAMALRRLDLPEPLVPSTTVKLPASSARSTLSSARTSPGVPQWNTWEIPSSRSAGSAMGLGSRASRGPEPAPPLRHDEHREHEHRGHQLERIGIEAGPDGRRDEQPEHHGPSTAPVIDRPI